MIKTAIICDPFCFDAEAEYAEIEERLKFMGLPIEVVIRGMGMHELKGQVVDLVIMDYGGLSYGAYDTGKWQVRALCEWARDNPRALVVLWTHYTQKMYEDEIEQEFTNLDNLVPYTTDGELLGPRLKARFV